MTMMTRRLATAFLIYPGVTGTSADEGNSDALRQLQVEADPSIFAIIASNTELTNLEAAMTVAGLDQDLVDLDLTALAPSNAGFSALDGNLFDLLSTPAWNLHLVDIMEYHLSNNPAFTFILQNDSEITMRNGEIVFVRTPSGVGNIYTFSNSKDEGAALIQGDIFASNGVAHIIDNILKPSFFYRSVIDLFGETYSTLQNLILIAGLENSLRDGTFTLFAPTNDAFNLLPAATISFLSSPAGNADLVEIIEYHTIDAVSPSTFLKNGVDIPTAQGKTISISVIFISLVEGTIRANDATVIEPDILALNGITHGIDRVLMIPEGTGQPTNAPVMPNEEIYPTIYMIAARDPDLSTLTTALESTGLDAVLNGSRATLTTLGPTNAAFDALPPGLIARLLTPAFSQHLTEIMQYHVSDEVFRSADLFSGKVITMLNGETVTYSISNAGVGAFDTRGMIETGDIEASNGVVHVINQVLVPSFGVRTTLDLGSNYSTWLTLIVLAGVEAPLSSDLWTLLAPNNAAFAKFDQAKLDFLTSTAGKDDLIEILTYHAIPQVLTSEKLSNGAMLATAHGGSVTISVANSQVKVNDATVVSPDILALNGVTHGIDTVLMPPTATETAFPTSAPISAAPTLLPTIFLTLSPTSPPTLLPTLLPTLSPTLSPKGSKSAASVLGSSLLGLFFAMALTGAW